MATLTAGTAAQLAARLRALIDYGASYKPPVDSVLADTLDGADRFASSLEAMGAAPAVIGPGSGDFNSADALAAQIVDEVMSGSYGPPRPPPAEGGGGLSSGARVAVAVVGGLALLGCVFALSEGYGGGR